MLVESVVTPQSIALAASSDASNAIPFLGLQFFPEAKKSGIDLRWIKTHQGEALSLHRPIMMHFPCFVQETVSQFRTPKCPSSVRA